MARIFFNMITEGEITIEQVPNNNKWRKQTQKLLDEAAASKKNTNSGSNTTIIEET